MGMSIGSGPQDKSMIEAQIKEMAPNITDTEMQTIDKMIDSIQSAKGEVGSQYAILGSYLQLVINGEPALTKSGWDQNVQSLLDEVTPPPQDTETTASTGGSYSKEWNPYYDVECMISIFISAITAARQKSLASKVETEMNIEAMKSMIEIAYQIAEIKIKLAEIEEKMKIAEAVTKFASAGMGVVSLGGAAKGAWTPEAAQSMTSISSSVGDATNSAYASTLVGLKGELEALETKLQAYQQNMQQMISQTSENASKEAQGASEILRGLQDQLSQLRKAFAKLW